MNNTVVFQVNAETDTLTDWLEVYLTDRRDDPDQNAWWFGTLRFNTPKGPVHLNQVVREADDDLPSVKGLSIQGQYSRLTAQDPPDEGHYLSHSETHWAIVIRFRMVPLGTERTEVTAECLEPTAVSYFEALLGAIAVRWPEAASSGLQEDEKPMPVSTTQDRRGPAEMTIKRAKLGKKVKGEHPKFSWDRIASHIIHNCGLTSEELESLKPGGGLTGRDIRNAYISMGQIEGQDKWRWEKGERAY
jgi:hypothetical protein